jgi:hypothetical protein
MAETAKPADWIRENDGVKEDDGSLLELLIFSES